MGGGDRNGLEVDPDHAYSDDDLFATSIDTGVNTAARCKPGQEDSHQYYNYGISVPPGAVITGIEVRLDAWTDSLASDPRICVAFSFNGGSGWSEPQTAFLTQTSETTYLLGGPQHDWGLDWVPGYLTDSNFRVRLILDATSVDREFYLDWVAVQVHYR